MNTTELLAVFRSEVADEIAPYLWSDALVYGYIDDAQKQFCRKTNGIEDSRSFKLAITPGTEWYKLDARILKVRQATHQSSGRPLDLMTYDKLDERGIRFAGQVGPVKTLVVGMEKGQARAHPIPNIAETVELHTYRLPKTVEAGDDFEIDDQHHPFLLHWVKHRAYNVQDAETVDKRKSDEFLGKFEAYCLSAKNDQNRVTRPAGTVIYGGL